MRGASLKVGLCGFTIGAAAYFEQFPVVEVQQTFYDPPPARTLERWRMQAPPGFEFTMKAWQVITHLGTSSTYKRLKSSGVKLDEAGAFRVNDTTLRAYDTTVLAQRILRATAILFQCPASFRGTDENIENMRRFFTTIERPKKVRFLWEPRGTTWPDDVVLSLCRELNLVHATDPFVRPTVTPELTYLRLHGNGSHYAKYTDAELRQLHDWLTPGAETYVMFNNIPRVDDAKRFISLSS